MKSSTARWTVTVAAAALLALPVAAIAQTPPATQPPATAQPAQPQADAPQSGMAQGSAAEHLRQARTALDEVGTANLGARARTQVAELKKRLANLEKMSGGASATTTTTTRGARAARSASNWGIEVAAMDKVLTSLLGSETTTGTVGTTGTTASKAAAANMLDDATRAKLTEFRTHLTAFAAAMASPAATAPSAPATTAPPTEPAPTTPPAQPPTTPTPTQPPTSPTPETSPAPGAKVDQEAARRHLTEARNILSQLTQLPAAAQLAGDARTQISQLITNFNELITAQSNWRASYERVSTNLTALIGPATGASPSGTEGAVGTSGGGMTLDPAIRQKLEELRTHLLAFERASGGSSGESAPAPSPAAPKPSAEPTATPPPTTPPATTPPATPPTAPSEPAVPASAAPSGDALTHIAAIEAILKAQNDSGVLTLDKTQVELLRTHIAELRKLLEKK